MGPSTAGGKRRRDRSAQGRSESPSALLRSLLVSIDLTPSSDRVLGRLARLPLDDEARVALLHVVPASLPALQQRRAERDAQRALAEEVRYLRKRLPRKVRIEPVVRLGVPAREIAACAAEMEVDLIVMGRGSGRVLVDTFLGSTAERVIRQAQRPVLVVRRPARGGHTRPMLALEQDPAAHEVVRFMLRLLPPPRPRIEVVHAFDVPYQGMVYPSLSEDELEEWKRALRSTAIESISKVLSEALERANIRPEESPSWKTHIRHGSPRVVVEKAMAKADTDLLVLGTHGRSGAAYALLGTVAGDLLRAAKCDVLIVPPPLERE